MKVKTVIFDLDDTLYDEIDFVYSGFNAVSNYFSNKYEFNEEMFFNRIITLFIKYGRGNVFDLALKELNIYNKHNVKKAISVYRLHRPNIKLPNLSIEIIKFLKEKNIPSFIVTDGNKIVQSNKIKALKLNDLVTKVYITHQYGVDKAKPSIYCFEKIKKNTKIRYEDMVYIGDNINKDFVNIKKIGIRTIRIKKGMFLNVDKPKEFHAEIEIEDLSELKKILILN